MLKIRNKILVLLMIIGVATPALAQSWGSDTKPDTLIYTTTEQLQQSVKAVAQAILDMNKNTKNTGQLSSHDIQLLKYQILLSQLGMSGNGQQNTSSDIDVIKNRLDNIQQILCELLQQRGDFDKSHPSLANDYTKEQLSTLGKIGAKRFDEKLSQIMSLVEQLRQENTHLRNQLKQNISSSTCDEAYCLVDTISIQTLSHYERQVFFALGSHKLTNNAIQTLNSVVKVLHKFPTVRLYIVGYASEDGNKVFNLQLSKKRARTVMRYLKNKGIKSCRLFFENGGIDKGADLLTTARRVDLKLKVYGKKSKH